MSNLVQGVMYASASLSAGSTLIAQTMLGNGTVEGYLAGGILLAVGGVIVKWMFRLLDEVRNANDRLRHAHEELEERLEVMTAKYDEERNLRIQLEEMGLHDRRKHDGE
jgi:hypothetical protein